jgi:hypothetical protein
VVGCKGGPKDEEAGWEASFVQESGARSLIFLGRGG